MLIAIWVGQGQAAPYLHVVDSDGSLQDVGRHQHLGLAWCHIMVNRYERTEGHVITAQRFRNPIFRIACGISRSYFVTPVGCVPRSM